MTGATYVPFDADTPQERVSEVLADLEAVLLLVDSNTSINHPMTLNVQTLSEDQTTTEDDKLPVEINIDSVAYIICTSGSTGKPKSIAITHRSICHFVRADNEMMQIRYDDIVYQGVSAAFDLFFEETFLAYLVGATLAIASKSDVLNTDRLHLFMIRHSITALFCVPTLLLLMTNDPALKLRLINTGGEACPKVSLMKRLDLIRRLTILWIVLVFEYTFCS
jgi:non-ribosomal peptide synthetase component F